MAHDQEVVGSNPKTVYWMDISDLLAITLKKNWKIKAAKWGTPKKYKKRLLSCSITLLQVAKLSQ
jgi:hypothetical protein